MIQDRGIPVRVLYHRSEDLAVRVIAGETLLMPVRSSGAGPGSLFVLNETGSVIWRGLENPAGIEAIVEELVAGFNVSREEAENDVAEYLSALEHAHLVTRGSEVGG